MKKTIQIKRNPYALNEFKQAFEKIERKADRYNVARPVITKIEEDIATINNVEFEVYLIEIEQEEEIKVGNYTLIGVNRRNINEFIYTNIHQEIVAPKEVQEKIECQHCNTNRRRNNYFILQNKDTKEFISVGATCCKDFFGVDIEKLNNRLITIVDELSELSEMAIRYTKSDVTRTVWTLIKLIAIYEVQSDLKKIPYSTHKDRVKRLMEGLDEYVMSQEIDEIERYIEENRKELEVQAEELTNEISKLDPKGNEYIENLQKILVGKEYMDRKFINYILYSYILILNKKKAEQDKNKKPSEYVGEVGQKINTTLTVAKAMKFDGYYGISYMYIMEDPSNNIFVWNTQKELEEDTTYNVRGVIKGYKEYKGVKQTVITRCRIH